MAIKQLSEIQTELDKGFSGMFRGLFKDLVDSLVSSLSDLSGQIGDASVTFARLHVQNDITAVIASIGVPVAVGGTSGDWNVDGTTMGCTVDTTNGTITYGGVRAKLCNLKGRFSQIPVSGMPQVRFNLEVNGSVVAFSQTQAIGSKNYHEAEITQLLQPGDVVRMTIQNNTDTVNLDVDEHITLAGDTGADNIAPTAGWLRVQGV